MVLAGIPLFVMVYIFSFGSWNVINIGLSSKVSSIYFTLVTMMKRTQTDD